MRGPVDHLPVVEPDRDLDDWGRSARLSGALDRTVWDAAYKYWFRVRLEHPKRVPSVGGALLVVNGGGGGSSIGPLVAKAIRETHPQHRDARPCVAPDVLAQPGLSVLLKRAGAVAAHAEDLQRLLADEGGLVVVAVHTDRLGDDDVTTGLARHPALVAAVRSGMPVVPIVARGIDDEHRVLGRVPLPGRRELPIRVGVPSVGPLSVAPFLPSAIDLRALTAITPDPDVAEDAERVALSVARRIRHEYADMLHERRSRWVR